MRHRDKHKTAFLLSFFLPSLLTFLLYVRQNWMAQLILAISL